MLFWPQTTYIPSMREGPLERAQRQIRLTQDSLDEGRKQAQQHLPKSLAGIKHYQGAQRYQQLAREYRKMALLR